MKYSINVTQTNGGYVGQAVDGSRIVYTSSLHSNPTAAANEVTNFIKNKPKDKIQNKNNASEEIDRSKIVPSYRTAPSPSRCCGRG